ncbi:unnamed protein product [Linum tenue]|uniref:ATP synthase F0 subunit 8 n=1 Tax=Linum tenue TaxID=586396 RepID=A0AAV0NQG4_9ROSI|nr:unnamed protein product [Linum tenue]
MLFSLLFSTLEQSLGFEFDLNVCVWIHALLTEFLWASFVMVCLVRLCWQRCLACWWFWIRCFVWFLFPSLKLWTEFS